MRLVGARLIDGVCGALRASVTTAVLVIPPPVTVIVALLVPTVAVAVLTLTVTVPLLVAEVGDTVNQLALPVAVHEVLDVTDSD